MRVILASQSPRRKVLLSRLGFDFEIIPGHIDETHTTHKPGQIVEELAAGKAGAVAAAIPDGLVIGADTIVVLDNEILGKPSGRTEAAEMLAKLSGRTHSVFTGTALIHKNSGKISSQKQFFEETKVTFGTLTPEEISAYVATNSPMDKAGAYGIQDDLGSLFVESINGDYNTIVGLPLYRLYQELKTFMPDLINVLKESV